MRNQQEEEEAGKRGHEVGQTRVREKKGERAEVTGMKLRNEIYGEAKAAEAQTRTAVDDYADTFGGGAGRNKTKQNKTKQKTKQKQNKTKNKNNNNNKKKEKTSKTQNEGEAEQKNKRSTGSEGRNRRMGRGK